MIEAINKAKVGNWQTSGSVWSNLKTQEGKKISTNKCIGFSKEIKTCNIG